MTTVIKGIQMSHELKSTFVYHKSRSLYTVVSL